MTSLSRRYAEHRPGDDASDLVLSDPGSVTSSESESESDSDDDDEHFDGSNPASSTTSLPLSTPSNLVAQADSAAISEFQHEVKQSLDRAFAEDHSVDNAAVELKTLRMASNVSLRLVRDAVITAIVSRIKIVEGGVPQRNEIARMVARWGGLIDKIGGVDAVETVEILQACIPCECLGPGAESFIHRNIVLRQIACRCSARFSPLSTRRT